MDHQTKECLISKIISGVYITSIGGILYILGQPDALHKHIAQLTYESAVTDFQFDGVLTRSEILPILVSLNIVPADIDTQISKLEKDVDQLKHKLYLHHLDPRQAKSLRDALKMTRNALAQMWSARHCLDHLTVEGYAEFTKTCTLFSSFLKTTDGNKVDDVTILEKVLIKYNTDRITQPQFRELARTEPWRSYWSVSNNVFKKPAIDLTDDQRSIILYSKMYESAYKSTETPDDYVINDDDLFDGWMIEQRKQADKERKNKKVDKHLGVKGQDADEIYIMAQDKSHIKEINSMNSLEATMIKKQREAALKVKGKLNEAELPDVKRELQMQAQQMAMQKFGKGK